MYVRTKLNYKFGATLFIYKGFSVECTLFAMQVRHERWCTTAIVTAFIVLQQLSQLSLCYVVSGMSFGEGTHKGVIATTITVISKNICLASVKFLFGTMKNI